MERVYKCFETKGQFYLYDRNKNKIIRISKEDYELLNGIKTEEEFEKNQDVFNRYTQREFLLPSVIKTIKHPVLETLEDHIERKIEHLILQITQNCNLRCSYCFYGEGNYENRAHSNKKMSFEIAKKAIDYMLKHSKDLDEINIGFYGGEPLLELELIKKCIEYAKDRGEGKKIKFAMTTNGTLLSDKNIEFLIKNDISVLISLDGNREMHNLNRRFANGEGSYDKIMENINHIKDYYPGYVGNIMFNAVISPENDFDCTKKFFDTDEVLEQFNANFSMVVDGYNNTINTDYKNQFYIDNNFEIFKTLLAAIGEIDEKHISKFYKTTIASLQNTYNMLKTENSILQEGHPGGPCIPGVLRLFVNAEGEFYPCERVSESSKVMNIGNLEKGVDIESAKRILNIGEITSEECLNCWAFNYCTLCARAADDIDELSKEKKLNACIGITNKVLEDFKNICTLKEFGYDFEGGNI